MEDTGETFKVEFFVTPQQTLVEDFNSQAWDYALAQAHKQGVIPIGPIHIETELVKPEPPPGLTEGQAMRVHSMMEALGGNQELVRVTATMMVGTRLG